MKKLSIIITGRNDDYYEDYIIKTSYVLNNTLETIYNNKLEKYFEIIFIDWGSQKPLYEVLFIEKKYRKSIKFYYVPKNIANKEIDYKKRINTSKAHNVGIRKSNSEFCLLSHSDQIFPSYVLKNLKNFISGNLINKNIFDKSYIYIPRKYLSFDFFKNFPSNIMAERYFKNINFSLHKWKNPSFLVGGGWGGILAKKKIFENLEGLKEDYYISKNEGQISPDLEYHQRSSSKFDSIDASNFGIFAYRFFEKDNNREKNLVKRLFPNEKKYKKNSDWGLNKKSIKNKKIQNNKRITHKDFDSKKISKTIDIKGDLKFIAATSSKNHLYNLNLEIVYLFYIIKYFKIYGYLEFFTENDRTFRIISSLFNGIEAYKVKIKKKIKSQKVSSDFQTLNSLKNTRIGYTKVCSYNNYNDCMDIFKFTSPEMNSLLIKVDINSKNSSAIIKKLNTMKSKISFILINKNFNISNKFDKNYELIVDKKDFSFLINKRIYKPKMKILFDKILKQENKIKALYTLYININRFRKI